MAEVRIQEGESLENALRRFKRKVQQEDIIKEVKRHSFYLKPGEKRRVSRPECGTLGKGDEQIVDKTRMPAGARKLGPLIVCNLHLWKQKTFAAKFALFLPERWAASVKTPVPQSEHDHIR